MNAADPYPDAGEALTALRRRVEICIRFEKAWTAGERPRIESYCLDVAYAERLELLRELAGVEAELRQAAGERPTHEEYRRRFPELAHAIPRLFEEEAPVRTPSSPRTGKTPRAGRRPKRDPSYNLLFGLLALQNNFIDRDALLAAFNTWVADKARSIGELLVARGTLQSSRHALVEALVQDHLKQHGDDPERSLAALSSIGSMRQDLERLDDSDLTASVARVSAAREAPDPEATSTWDGSPTLRGDRFRVLRPFEAKGNLGELFVAHDMELHREVLLKQVKIDHADQEEIRARFLLEAEITGNLEHPGIVPVYGLGTYANGRPFYAMRRIKGQSLKDAVADFHLATGGEAGRGLAFQRLLRRFVDVCNTIAYAHSRGVLHRDIKPANIMVGPYGETIVIDWGLAKPVGHQVESKTTPTEGTLHPASATGSPETIDGSVIGTPQYMSPEQAAGQADRVGPASDVYSLGATLYVLLTGSVPFQGSFSEVLGKVRRGEFHPPRQVTVDVSHALQAVCLKAMALRPEDRYPSARELGNDIERWLADEPVSVGREPVRERFARWARHHKTLVSGALVLALVVPAALAALTMIRERAEAAKSLAEQKARTAERSRELEEQKARSAEQLRLVQQYHNLIAPPSDLERSKLGWTWERFARLEEASRLNVPPRDPARLRSEVADCLAAVDAREADAHVLSLLVLEPPVPLLARDIPDASCLAFSPDGRFLALGQHKTTGPVRYQVRILDLEQQAARSLWVTPKLSALERSEGARVLAFTPQSRGLALGTRYGWIYLWDLNQPEPTLRFWRGHSDSVTGLAFSPDGRQLFSGSSDRTVKCWDLSGISSGKTPPVEILAFESAVLNLNVSPKGDALFCATNSGIEIVQVAPLRHGTNQFSMAIKRVAVGPDGRTLAANAAAGSAESQGGRVVLLDLEHREEIRSFQDPNLLPGESHQAGDLDLEFASDGSLLLTACRAGQDHTLKLWGVASGRLLVRIATSGSIHDTSFSPNGRYLAISTTRGVTLYELGGASVQTIVALNTRPISAINLDSEGRALVCASEPHNPIGRPCDPEISIWETVTWQRTRRYPNVPDGKGVDICTSVSLSPSGTSLAASWPSSNRILIFNPSGGDDIRTIQADDAVALGFSQDGTRLWAAAGETVRAWAVSDWSGRGVWSNAVANVVSGHPNIYCLAIGRDWVLAGGGDGSLREFAAPEGPQLKRRWPCSEESEEPVRCISLDATEQVAAAATQDGEIALFQLPSGKPIARRAKAHQNSIEAMSFFPNSRLLVTGSKDWTIRLWRVSDGSLDEILTLRSPTGPIDSIRLTSDGKRLLAVVHGETAVRVWHLNKLRERLKPLNLDWE
jgi:WD40 repeat protein/tRNA A-37 threonylcarbamoyl transferase component Bud32